MHEDEQQPGTESIDHQSASSATEAASISDASTTVNVSVSPERKELVSEGNWATSLLASGVIAVVMAVAFIIGVETIFPGPPTAAVSAESTEAPVVEQPATSASDAAKTDPKASPASKDDGSKETPPASTETDPDPKTTQEPATPSKTSLEKSIEAPPLPSDPRLLLTRVVRVSASEDAANADSGSDRPGVFGRFLLFIKFLILVCLSAILAMVSLGGLALMTDRPLGDFKAACAKVLLTCWIATLALFVPSPEPWLRDLIHYAAAAALFWLAGMLLLRLTPRLSATLLGGTVALLAVTAIGSRIVVWATW